VVEKDDGMVVISRCMKLFTLVLCFSLGAGTLSAQSSLTIDYHKADSVAALYPKHSLKNLQALSDKLTLPFTREEEKFRSIYKWVCNNIDYDYEMNTQNQTNRAKALTEEDLKSWNDKMRTRVFNTLLTKQRSVCTGYAYLVSEMAKLAGLRCKIVDGYGRTAQANIGGKGIVNHSWNVVQLNGRWYLCDPTWSTGAYNVAQRQFLRQYNNVYFLADPELFIRNHYPLDSTWTLLEQYPTLEQFLTRPLIYADLYTFDIRDLYPETFKVSTKKGETVSFRFNSNQEITAKTEIVIQHGSVGNTFPITLKNDSPRSYSFDQVFKARGNNALHLLLDGKYIATWEIDVK
jgi:hypothetical protein